MGLVRRLRLLETVCAIVFCNLLSVVLTVASWDGAQVMHIYDVD